MKFNYIYSFSILLLLIPFLGLGQPCDDFQNGLGGWETYEASINSSANISSAPEGDGNYLVFQDGISTPNTSSSIYNESFSNADYSEGFYELCFDFLIINDGDGQNATEVPIQIQLYGGTFENPGFTATFTTSFTVSENSGWVHVCLPLEITEEQLPANDSGTWSIPPGTTIEDWNLLMGSVGGASFNTDLNSEPTETFGLDNFCVESVCPEYSIAVDWNALGMSIRDLCELDSWPLMVVDRNGDQVFPSENVTITWLADGDINFEGATATTGPNTQWLIWVDAVGCDPYKSFYYHLCCLEELEIIELPFYDPCVSGFYFMQIVDGEGNPLPDNIRVTWNDGATGSVRSGFANETYNATVIFEIDRGTTLSPDTCEYEVSYAADCGCTPPEGLFFGRNCHRLQWNGNGLVDDYIVEFTWNDRDCCESEYWEVSGQYRTDDNEYTFNWPQGTCGSARIGTTSLDGEICWSEKICYECSFSGGGGNVRPTNFVVSPNPGNGLFNIDFKETFTGDIRVFGFQSRVVLDKKIQSQDWFTADLSNQPEGNYYLVISDGKETSIELLQIQRNR